MEIRKKSGALVVLDDFTIPQDVALICAQLGDCSVTNVGIEPMVWPNAYWFGCRMDSGDDKKNCRREQGSDELDRHARYPVVLTPPAVFLLPRVGAHENES